MIRAAALALVSLWACRAPIREDIGPVPMGVRFTITEEVYEVHGRTPDELRESIRARGPLFDGRRWDGRTQSDLRWTYRSERDPAGCRLSNVRIELRSIVTLPAWTGEPQASEPARHGWRRYLAALRSHEHGHVRIALDGAREVRRALESARAPCTTLPAHANARAQARWDETRERQRAFDRETAHGRRQGVVLRFELP